jgi:tripartite-type tricarboxylate transporter receptor subunit TctC
MIRALTIRGWYFAIIAATLGVGLAGAAAQAPEAAPWPTKSIKAYIPFGAGSATDVVPRAVFDGLATELGQPIVIENRGGAGGTLGVGAVGGRSRTATPSFLGPCYCAVDRTQHPL